MIKPNIEKVNRLTKKVPTKTKLQLFLLGVSQKEIARMVGVSPAYVSRCVNGRQKPSKKIIKAVSQLAGLTNDVLWGDGK